MFSGDGDAASGDGVEDLRDSEDHDVEPLNG
jgi:hypothetical protein